MQNAAENTISPRDIDALLSAHDGDVALLYLYLLRPGADLEGAARTLCRTGGEIAAAAEKLRRMGLTVDAPKGGARPAPAQELPEYTAEDIVRRSSEDSSFKAVVAETQRLLGRSLSSADLRTLFGIYDYLGLPAEVILELLHYCTDACRERYGEGRVPSMRSIEKEAYLWANLELITIDAAEEYIRREREKREQVNQIKSALNIRGRDLTPTERKYISSWLDLGFGERELESAFDRTVMNTGSLKWPYMNKILQSWHEKGLHTLDEIERKDAAPSAGRTAAPAVPAKNRAEGLSALRKKINNQGQK